MKPPDGQARSPLERLVSQGFGAWSRALAVPVAGSAGAAVGVVIGYVIGRILLHDGVIQPGTSVHMAPAVVGALAGGAGWLTGAIACMVAFRKQAPLSRAQVRGLLIAAAGFACAGILLAALVFSLQDPFKDPRMFRLHRLIWLDSGLAAGTCLLVAQRRWKPIVAMTALFVIGVVVAAASVSQFLPFLSECAPVPGGDCRIGF